MQRNDLACPKEVKHGKLFYTTKHAKKTTSSQSKTDLPIISIYLLRVPQEQPFHCSFTKKLALNLRANFHLRSKSILNFSYQSFRNIDDVVTSFFA